MDYSDDEPLYTWKILDYMAFQGEGNEHSEYMATLHDNFHDHGWSHIKDIIMMDTACMENLEN